MPTASSATAHATASSTTTHATAATAHAAPETAMHASADAGPAAEGVLVCHAAVVESAECAGVAAPLHVRRDESAIARWCRRRHVVAVKSCAVDESVTVVEKVWLL
jgi:hypothetical protein